MEKQRKEEAAKAIAALEGAETAAVGVGLRLLPSNSTNDTAPGILAEASVETTVGIVKMAAISLQSLQEAGGGTTIAAAEAGAVMTVRSEHLQQAGSAGAAAGLAAEGPLVITIMGLSQETSSKLAKDNVLAGRRLASALTSKAISVNFWTSDGVRIPLSGLNPPLTIVMEVDDPNATCAFWDEGAAKWSDDGVSTLPGPEPHTITCSTTHLTVFGGVVDAVLKLC